MKTHALHQFCFLFTLLISTSGFGQNAVEILRDTLASPYSGDTYGKTVAISHPFMFVGAENRDFNVPNFGYVTNCGSVTVYKVDSIGNWGFYQELFADSIIFSENYGKSIAVSEGRAVVGSLRGNSAGEPVVFCYELDNSGVWTLSEKLTPPEPNVSQGFSSALALEDTNLIVGAANALTYDSTNTQWQPTGAVCVYSLNGSGMWINKYRVSDLQGEAIGHSLDISGNWVVAGAPDSWRHLSNIQGSYYGAAYFIDLSNPGAYQRVEPSLTQQYSYFGGGVAIDGTSAMIGMPGAPNWFSTFGFVNVYTLNPSTRVWIQRNMLFGGVSKFGASISMNDGRAVVGAPEETSVVGGKIRAGAAYLYESTRYYSNPPQHLVSSSIDSNEYFGSAVAIEHNTIGIGAIGEHAISYPNAGAIYIFNDTCSIRVNDYVSTCDSFYVWRNDSVYTSELNHPTLRKYSPYGCDTVWVMQLTLNEKMSMNVVKACDSFTWIDGNTYNYSTDTVQFKLTSAAGCDSTAYLDLRIGHPDTIVHSVSRCNQFEWINGIVYTQSTQTPTMNFTNQYGCDSIVQLHLQIEKTDTGVQYVSQCRPFRWIDGRTYTETTDTAYYRIYRGMDCDSILFLDFHLIPLDTAVTLSGSTFTSNDTNATFYRWMDCSNGNIIYSGTTARSYTPSVNGTYAVIVSGPGCMDTSACYTINNVGMMNEVQSAFNLYPNPTSGEVRIDLSESFPNVEVEVYSVNGQLLISKNYKECSSLTLELNLPTGTYICRVNSNGNRVGESVLLVD